MFLRLLTELSEFVQGETGAADVEIYYRCTWSERKIAKLVQNHGVRAFTRIRWQRDGLEWSVGIGSFMPSREAVAALLEIAVPEKASVPIPTGGYKKPFIFRTLPKKGANRLDWFRDFLVTASGLRLIAEGRIKFFEDESGLWSEKPECPVSSGTGTGNACLLPPSVTLKLLESGFLKGIVCRADVKGFLHSAFDRIDGRRMGWCRTPDNLSILSGAVGISVATGSAGAGQLCDNVGLYNKGEKIRLFCGDTKNCTVDKTVLNSMKKVSTEYQLYRNGVMFRLPWVELQGGIQWESH